MNFSCVIFIIVFILTKQNTHRIPRLLPAPNEAVRIFKFQTKQKRREKRKLQTRKTYGKY